MNSAVEAERQRKVKLQENWEKRLPCSSCQLVEMCKYAHTVRRVDYPSDIFEVTVTCKIQNNYKAVK